MRSRGLVVLPVWLALGSIVAPAAAGDEPQWRAISQTSAVSVPDRQSLGTDRQSLRWPPGGPERRASPADRPSLETGERWPARIGRRLTELRARALPPAPLPPIDAALQAELAAIAAAAGPRTQVGISVRALDSGATLFDREGDRLLNPASNQKLLTAIAALELLGADYRFETRVLRDGDTLVLVGDGDPSLQPTDLHALARSVAARSDLPPIRRIVVDDHAFTPERFGPGYDPDGPGYSYMAPSGALSLQWNTVAVTVSPTERGAPVDVRVDPPCAHLDVVVEATTGRGAPLAIETRQSGDRTQVIVRGRLGKRAAARTIRRRIADPALFTGSAFARALVELGVVAPDLTEPEVVRGRAPHGAMPIARHASPPLHEVLHSALKYSNNFTTEQILRTLGHRLTGEPGDWTNGREALARFWRALGRDPNELVFENAAGYSRRGRTSARTLVDLLHWALRDGAQSQRLLSALAIAGEDGTMRDRLPDAAGRVLAKTGSLAGTSALTGVIVDDAGTPRVGFSILVNGAIDRKTGARLQDRLVRALLAHG